MGKVRAVNQDAVFISNEKIGVLDNLFIVADGMGGHKAGEVAAAASIEAFLGYVKAADSLGEQPHEFLKNGVQRANAGVYEMQQANKAWRGMGTTFSVCAVAGGRLHFAHVGDSRIYIIINDTITQISNDHSLVAEMLRMGRITPEEADLHPKNILTRALGTETSLEVDSGSAELPEGAAVLICSDGLNNMVTDADILRIMGGDSGAEDKAAALIEAALESGGTDNISLIIIY